MKTNLGEAKELYLLDSLCKNVASCGMRVRPVRQVLARLSRTTWSLTSSSGAEV